VRQVMTTADRGPGTGGLLTVAEAASELRMGYAATLAAIHRGDLQARRIGKQYRVSQASIDALVTPQGRRETL